MARTSHRALACCSAGVAVVLVAGVGAAARAAAATRSQASSSGFERIVSYDSDATIRRDGSLLVRERIVYDFGVARRHGIFRLIRVRVDYPQEPDHDRVYPLHVQSVRGSPGTPTQVDVEEEGDSVRIRIGDPDRTITGVHEYDITYRVRGVLNGFADHDELVWNAVGTDWNVPIDGAVATVHAPAAIIGVNCATGYYGSTLSCPASRFVGADATFAIEQLFENEGMTVTVAFPKGAVPAPRPILEERFTVGSAFRVTLATGAIAGALLVLVLAAFAMFAGRFTRDRRYAGSPVDAAYGSADGKEETVPLFDHTATPVEFVPPDGLRPGQIGTLVDFTANPLDVTATIVDLAVRGYLVIEELPPTGLFHGSHDWKLTKKKDSTDLLPYEQALMAGLFKDGEDVRLSDLRQKFAARMQGVRTLLADDAVSRGWFVGTPVRARVKTALIAVPVLLLGIGITAVLAWTTHAALVGVPLVVAGILLLEMIRWAPHRTAKGFAELRHVDGFRRFIDESEKERARFAERQNIFSEYLPYAIVFGATQKWARAFAGLGAAAPDTSSWYVSPAAFDYVEFGSAVDSFTTTTSGTLVSTPSSTSGGSGFSGGGFSGGGFGGGGGGSW